MTLALTTSTDFDPPVLLRAIKTRTPLMENYLVQFWLDHGYDYHLMDDLPQGYDWDHQVTASVHYAAGKTEKLSIPPLDMGPGDRRERYQRLAWYVGWYVDRANAEQATDLEAQRKLSLPASIGGGLLLQKAADGAKSVEIGCVFHQGLSRELLAPNDAADKDTAIKVPADPMAAKYFTPVPDSADPNPKPLNVLVKLGVDGRPVPFAPLPVGETSPVRKPSAARANGATTAPAREKGSQP